MRLTATILVRLVSSVALGLKYNCVYRIYAVCIKYTNVYQIQQCPSYIAVPSKYDSANPIKQCLSNIAVLFKYGSAYQM